MPITGAGGGSEAQSGGDCTVNKPTEATATSEAGEQAMANGTAVNGTPKPERPPENAASPTMATLLGEIVWLLTQSPSHRHLFLADLEWAVMPALLLRQIHLFRSKGKVVGLALWASVSDEVDARLSSGVTRLAPLEWKGGETLWLIDIIAPFGGTENMLKEITTSLIKNKSIKYWKVGEDGKKQVFST